MSGQVLEGHRQLLAVTYTPAQADDCTYLIQQLVARLQALRGAVHQRVGEDCLQLTASGPVEIELSYVTSPAIISNTTM